MSGVSDICRHGIRHLPDVVARETNPASDGGPVRRETPRREPGLDTAILVAAFTSLEHEPFALQLAALPVHGHRPT
ncbi:hypothetical protein BH11GEM1_BH11GEM1_08280 [soil metagenome]